MNVSADAVVMPAMLATAVMTMNPMMAVIRPVTGHPDHLVIALPVTRPMTIIWLVTNFDSKTLRLNGTSENETRSGKRHEQ
jgi:hypothetical protein